MKEVTGSKIPITVTSTVTKVWSKKAKSTKDAMGKPLYWDPTPEELDRLLKE